VLYLDTETKVNDSDRALSYLRDSYGFVTKDKERSFGTFMVGWHTQARRFFIQAFTKIL
jgi:hypothetical protein